MGKVKDNMKGTEKKLNGVRIRTVNYVMILIAVILYAFILYAMFQVSHKYNALIDATEKYVSCEKFAAMVTEGSDILTEQVRLYVITADLSYAKAYFQEANVDQKRDTALNELKKFHSNDEVHDYLQSALDYSNALMDREIYAMKLISEAENYEMDTLPQEVQDTQLSSEDLSLSKKNKHQKAQEMVFDEGYEDAKKLIMDNISYCLASLLKDTRLSQENSAQALKKEINIQRVEISMLFVMNIIIFFFITILIIKPLQIYIRCIQDNKALEIIGSYEFKYLAVTYNDIYEVNAANQIMLKNKAEHDPLTGLLNRGAFDKLHEELKLIPDPISLLLIDVDNFKSVNDQYGHDVGDQVLQKVAKSLTSNFRSKDFICRIGGDEFAAILLTGANDVLDDKIREKVERINQKLQAGGDGLPKVSLSVGVATSPVGFDDQLYQRADKALYQVKKHGRCGCEFYR